MKKHPLATDDYGNAPEMAPRPIIDPLTDEETKALVQQLKIALMLVNDRVRIPDDLIRALDTLERRFFATADESRLYAEVKEAARKGKPLAKGRNPSAFDSAAAELDVSAGYAEKIYYTVENMKRKPLANTPKKAKS